MTSLILIRYFSSRVFSYSLIEKQLTFGISAKKSFDMLAIFNENFFFNDAFLNDNFDRDLDGR